MGDNETNSHSEESSKQEIIFIMNNQSNDHLNYFYFEMKTTKNMRLLCQRRIFTNFRFQHSLSSQDINTSNFGKKRKVRHNLGWGCWVFPIFNFFISTTIKGEEKRLFFFRFFFSSIFFQPLLFLFF